VLTVILMIILMAIVYVGRIFKLAFVIILILLTQAFKVANHIGLFFVANIVGVATISNVDEQHQSIFPSI
jgi:hypothetical protein